MALGSVRALPTSRNSRQAYQRKAADKLQQSLQIGLQPFEVGAFGETSSI